MTQRLIWAISLALVGLTSLANADCVYFRTHTKPLHCHLVPPSTTPNSDALLSDTDEGPTLQLTCSCDYTLKGSGALAPQCDLDHNDEPSFIAPVKDRTNPCGRSHQLCEDLCPKDTSN